MLYSAVVKDKYDSNKKVVLEYQEYPNKAEFIKTLRKNGFAVDPLKVKKSDVFNYIMSHTNCNTWDWKNNK